MITTILINMARLFPSSPSRFNLTRDDRDVHSQSLGPSAESLKLGALRQTVAIAATWRISEYYWQRALPRMVSPTQYPILLGVNRGAAKAWLSKSPKEVQSALRIYDLMLVYL